MSVIRQERLFLCFLFESSEVLFVRWIHFGNGFQKCPLTVFTPHPLPARLWCQQLQVFTVVFLHLLWDRLVHLPERGKNLNTGGFYTVIRRVNSLKLSALPPKPLTSPLAVSLSFPGCFDSFCSYWCNTVRWSWFGCVLMLNNPCCFFPRPPIKCSDQPVCSLRSLLCPVFHFFP